jgi:hypothetical protein
MYNGVAVDRYNNIGLVRRCAGTIKTGSSSHGKRVLYMEQTVASKMLACGGRLGERSGHDVVQAPKFERSESSELIGRARQDKTRAPVLTTLARHSR